VPKRILYQEFIRRIDSSIEAAAYLEASWYAYAVLEDRLISMLRQSGGYPSTLRMMGPKIARLKERAASDPVLAATFDSTALSAWSAKRNALMHAMAEGSLTIQQVDRDAKDLATEGRAIVRDMAARAMRLKRRRRQLAP
jgi:hypothetical protein